MAAVTVFGHLVILIFLLSANTSAQDCSSYPEGPERRRCEENLLNSARMLAGTRFLEADRSLVSQADGAWVLHIITHGGFAGQGLPTITVRSSGEYACGEAEPLVFKALPAAQVRALSELILWPEFGEPKKLTKIDQTDGIFCSDCFSGKILFARREANRKIRSYDSSSKLSRYVEAAAKLNSIHKNVSDFISCK